MQITHRRPKAVFSLLAAITVAALCLAACGSSGSKHAAAATPTSAAATSPATSKVVALEGAMRTLWHQHMEWTYVTVDAFFHDQSALQPSLDRLLQNQKDIGSAIVPYYGQAAGTKLANLLTIHIKDAVPVLKAAQANDAAALKTAETAWYANAKQIADFLSAANPKNWPTSATEPMLKEHITQTITYSVDLLKGDYQQAIVDFGAAEQHMAEDMADVLTKGIVAQFPAKFAS